MSAASPEIREDDHTCDCRIRTPWRRERVAFELHYNQENRQVCHAEDYHRPDLREKQRTARCNHKEHRDRCIVRCLIDVHNTIPHDVHLQWIRLQRPQYIKRSCSTEHEERQHASAAFPARLKQQHA